MREGEEEGEKELEGAEEAEAGKLDSSAWSVAWKSGSRAQFGGQRCSSPSLCVSCATYSTYRCSSSTLEFRQEGNQRRMKKKGARGKKGGCGCQETRTGGGGCNSLSLCIPCPSMVQPMRVCCPTPSKPVQPLKPLRTQCVAQCAEPGTCLTSTMGVCYVFCLKSSRRSVLELQSFDSKLPAIYKSNHALLQNHLIQPCHIDCQYRLVNPHIRKVTERGIPKVDK